MSQSDITKSIDEFVNPEKKERAEKAEKAEKAKNINWSAFVESEVVSFFDLYEFEKMTIEDENGNKAKLIRQKDNGVKIETSSITIV